MKNKIKILFLIIFVIIFFISMDFLSNLEEYIPPKSYEYEIMLWNLDSISNLKIYQDFSSKKGNITFQVESDKLIANSAIHIHSPSITNNLKIYSYIDNKTKRVLEVNKDYNLTEQERKEGSYTLIKIDEINLINEEDTFYSIEYTMDILPSGRFEIMHLKENEFIRYTPTITLYLGKKFQCFKNCIEKGVNIEYYRQNTAKEINLEILDGKGVQHVFWLTAIKDIRIEQGISLGVLVSSIVSFFLILKEWWEDLLLQKKIRKEIMEEEKEKKHSLVDGLKKHL